MPDYARVFEVAPAPFLLLTPDFVIVHANQARREVTATTVEENVGRNVFDLFPANPDDPAADGVANFAASLAEARDTGRPVTMAIQKYDIRMPDGTYQERFWSPRNVPIRDDAGRVVLLLHRSDDITDYIRDRDEARREAARGQHRVAQVESDLFSRARELEQLNARLREVGEQERRTARSLTGLATTVSALAQAETTRELLELLFEHASAALGVDAAAVALAPADGGPLTLTEFRNGRLYTAELATDSALPMAVAASGAARIVRDAELSGWSDPEATRVAEGLGVRSWAALPLRAGGRLLGSWTVGWTDPRTLADDELQVLEAYAAQCAQAVERVARLEDERRRASATRSLAEALQRSLLTAPPQPDHLRIGVRYRPAAREAQVGGDWYDAFLSAGGATTLVVGDVTGHDRDAAAAMGQLRNLLRGIAHTLAAPPAAVLDSLDRALHDLGVATMATAVVARVEQATAGLRTLRWASAGHLPPLLVTAAGAVSLLERPPDVLLGVDPAAARADHTVQLAPGDTVVLYTDGLVERRDATLDDGLDRLVAAAAELAATPVDEVGDVLLARLAPDFADDVALLALRISPED
ncbi:SpoIIE family protein phosphatase [Modestobacter sp. SYSU DS0290]